MVNFTKSFDMVVSEKENGRYVARGKVVVGYPSLSDLAIPDAAEGALDDEGFITYTNPLHQWLFSAALAAIRANARNKLQVVDGVVGLKDGQSLPTSTEELLESTGNSGAALALHREFITAVKYWVTTLGKSAAVADAIFSCFKTPEIIAFQDGAKRARTRFYLGEFASMLSPENAVRYSKKLEAINTACDAINVLDDDAY